MTDITQASDTETDLVEESDTELEPEAGAIDAAALELLERVRAVNDRFPGPEALKFSVRTAAEQVLAEYAAMPEPPGVLSLAVVKLLRHMRKYPEALAVLQARKESPAALHRQFLFLEMVLTFACGNEAQAMDMLSKLESSGKLRPSWKRSIAKMRSRFGRADARKGIKELERGMQTLECVPDVDTHLPLMKGRYRNGNTALELLVFVRDRMRLLHDITDPTDLTGLSLFDKYHRAKLVFTCGFSWSGSGAVSCFLRQHKEVFLPFGMSELGYVQGKAGREGLFAVLRKAPCDLAAMKKMLAQVLVSSIFCLSTAGNNGPLKGCCANEEGRIPVLGRLIDDFVRLMLSREALYSVEARSWILGRFLECLLSIRGGSTILLNNVLMAAKLELVPFMERSSFVVVQRDVRDQFTARSIECRDMHELGLDVQSFHAYVGGNRARFEQARREIVRRSADDKMLFIKFEDFIREEAVRMRVLDFLGLDPAGLVPDTAKFDASVSVKNIGIHRTVAKAQDVAYLEREMGVYLPQTVASDAAGAPQAVTN